VDVANRLQTILDGIGPTFKTIIEVEERRNKVAQTPRRGQSRVALPLGAKSTPGKTPLKKTRSQGLVKVSPLKRPREEVEDTIEVEDRALPTPKRARLDSLIGSEISVIEESDFAEGLPSSETEVESILRSTGLLIGIGRGNASTIEDLPDENAEEDGGMDAMEVDEAITRSRIWVGAQQESGRLRSKPEPSEVPEDVQGMDWPTLAAYRKQLIDARRNERDTTELSRARWRPVFADREFWDKVAV
jgi:hypothetical protein